jgi:DNA invertase Pin-like site-specific DNA recombinase
MTNTNILQSHHSPKGRYLAYLRVSTLKQGEGVSLLSQRETIVRFAVRKHLRVVGWYEEKETAARRGRPIFREVLQMLRSRKADGLIVYKVDRSARNLKDWAELGELIDQGIPVYFASDDLDMSSRSGRLAADIQAVVAADFIRNLREEAKRGIRKRLEQGFRPNGAPIGYLDQGKGQPKEIDPEKGPLVRLAFTWYATGEYTLRKLNRLLFDLGLRNRFAGRMTLSGLSHLLRNPFYIGYLDVRATGELLPGVHPPLVDRKLFFDVQARLKTRIWPRRMKHQFKYSRLLRCATCGKCLVGSLAKGRVYYRCMTMTCPTVSVREDRVEIFMSATQTSRSFSVGSFL